MRFIVAVLGSNITWTVTRIELLARLHMLGVRVATVRDEDLAALEAGDVVTFGENVIVERERP